MTGPTKQQREDADRRAREAERIALQRARREGRDRHTELRKKLTGPRLAASVTVDQIMDIDYGRR
jgi:hypothetical protein